jgi:hypothetical protein
MNWYVPGRKGYGHMTELRRQTSECMFCGKTWRRPKARVDLAALCDRPILEMKPPSGGKTWRRPKADFILSRAQRKEVLPWIKMLMFLDGYAANLSRG